ARALCPAPRPPAPRSPRRGRGGSGGRSRLRWPGRAASDAAFTQLHPAVGSDGGERLVFRGEQAAHARELVGELLGQVLLLAGIGFDVVELEAVAAEVDDLVAAGDQRAARRVVAVLREL